MRCGVQGVDPPQQHAERQQDHGPQKVQEGNILKTDRAIVMKMTDAVSSRSKHWQANEQQLQPDLMSHRCTAAWSQQRQQKHLVQSFALHVLQLHVIDESAMANIVTLLEDKASCRVEQRHVQTIAATTRRCI